MSFKATLLLLFFLIQVKKAVTVVLQELFITYFANFKASNFLTMTFYLYGNILRAVANDFVVLFS